MSITDKKIAVKDSIKNSCGCRIGCKKCWPKLTFIDDMADANIPVAYWLLSYKDFSGPKNIQKATRSYSKDIKANFNEGTSICFAGTPGTGKTYSACTILKTALAHKYTAYYTTLPDLVAGLTDFKQQDILYNKLSNVNFLCIDEVDSRHYSESENSEKLFGRMFEKVVRHRVQNQLPLIIATNNSKIEEAFTGQFKKIVESISSASTIVVPALGPDYRLKSGRPK